jgi:peptidoglycan/xylan/chitin deacetylase (PgdA/CDA1 family)
VSLPALLAATHAGPALAKPLGERALRRRCRALGALCLTYDDGPSTRLTPRVLDALAEREARATFFALGARAAGAPAVLDRLVAAGHEVGCHGHDHLDALRSRPAAARRDVERGFAALAPWTGAGAPFRPPHGRLAGASWLAARRRGAPLAWWTVDGADTRPDLPDPEEVVRAVAAAGGAVVLLHDFDRDPPEPEREDFVVGLTGALLAHAERAGWRVLTAGELLRA